MKKKKSYDSILREEARKFKLTGEDLSNLYELLIIIDSPDGSEKKLKEIVAEYHMEKWFEKTFAKFEKFFEDIVEVKYGRNKQVGK